ncbi:MAG: hypothetical protein J6S85_05515 [Methanobrevibacter sp.]|nr:hypothetical protein [Methanobrevibacter sp.]
MLKALTDYYIKNYFHYNPKTVSKKFRNKVYSMVHDKLIDSNIHVVDRDNNVINQQDDTDAVLKIERMEAEIRSLFANAAYNYHDKE